MADDPENSDNTGQEAQVLPFARKDGACPVCGQSSAATHRPFCSERCADVDLGRWLKGGYRIPGPPAESGDGAEEAADEGGAAGEDETY